MCWIKLFWVCTEHTFQFSRRYDCMFTPFCHTLVNCMLMPLHSIRIYCFKIKINTVAIYRNVSFTHRTICTITHNVRNIFLYSPLSILLDTSALFISISAD